MIFLMVLVRIEMVEWKVSFEQFVGDGMMFLYCR